MHLIIMTPLPPLNRIRMDRFLKVSTVLHCMVCKIDYLRERSKFWQAVKENRVDHGDILSVRLADMSG